MSVWVVNTSPLVYLGHLGRLDLLRGEGREICLPKAVFEEVTAKSDAAASAVQMACDSWMKVRGVSDLTARWLALAVIPGAIAITRR